MRNWIFTFFVLMIIAGLMSFTNLASWIAQFSQSVFYVFLALFILSAIFYILKKAPIVLSLALIFLAITGITGVLAFTQLTEAMTYIAKISFYVFMGLFVITFAIHATRRP